MHVCPGGRIGWLVPRLERSRWTVWKKLKIQDGNQKTDESWLSRRLTCSRGHFHKYSYYWKTHPNREVCNINHFIDVAQSLSKSAWTVILASGYRNQHFLSISFDYQSSHDVVNKLFHYFLGICLEFSSNCCVIHIVAISRIMLHAHIHIYDNNNMLYSYSALFC